MFLKEYVFGIPTWDVRHRSPHSAEIKPPLPLPPSASSYQWGTAEHSYRSEFAWELGLSLPVKSPPFLAPTMVTYPLFLHLIACSYCELVGRHWTGESIGDQEKGNIASWLESPLSLTPCPLWFSALALNPKSLLWTNSCTVLGPVAFEASASSLNYNSLPISLLLPVCFCEPFIARFVRMRLHPLQPGDPWL